MNQHSTKKTLPDLDTQVLSDFIYDLNIARRQLSLYPPDHPRIIDSSNTVLQILKKLCEFREVITFGIAPETLIFEQNRLDQSNPVYRDFARFFSSLNIASISFYSDLTTAELVQFNQILRSNQDTQESSGGFATLLKQQKIHNISIIPVDYSAFQANDGETRDSASSDNLLWDDFLQELLAQRLNQDGKAVELRDRVDPALVAKILNQAAEEGIGKEINYDQVISSFIAKMQSNEKQSNPELGQQLGTLARNLNPELKRSFLNSTFLALDRHPKATETFLQTLSQDVITDSLQQHNQGQLNISTRLVDLLGQFSAHTSATDAHKVTGSAEPLADEILKARVEILLLEDNHDDYVPSDYQKALQHILNGEVKGTVPLQTAQRLKYNLEKQSVERQCCAIIFNMLRNQVNPDVEAVIQKNLAELARFFLDTGDFPSLQEIFIRWSEYLYGGKANARFLDEKVLAVQTREVFMNEVLDNIELWGQNKYDEICDYITEVGEPYTELLIDRLGHEKQITQRKTWMKLLIKLGSKGHQIIIQALQDKRWYLVRNLLIVLGRQKKAPPMKAVHQLTTHPHPKVRQEALRILFRYNSATANRLLLKELSCGNKQVLSATIPLAKLSQDEKVLDQLHQIINIEHLNEENFALKKQILDTLATLGKPKSIPILAKLLKKKGLIRTQRQKQLQLEIIKTLGSYPFNIVEPLINSLIKGRNREHSRLARTQLHSQAKAHR